MDRNFQKWLLEWIFLKLLTSLFPKLRVAFRSSRFQLTSVHLQKVATKVFSSPIVASEPRRADFVQKRK